MAESSYTRAELVAEALRLINVIRDDEEPTDTMAQKGSERLNRMLRAWKVDGIHLWKISTSSVDLTSSTASISFGTGGDVSTRPNRIVQCEYRNSNQDTPMVELSRDEYLRLPDKTQEGTPTQFYYDPQVPLGTLYLWPVPDTTTSAGTPVIRLTGEYDITEMTTASSTIDFPEEWEQALTYNLAEILAPRYGVPLQSKADVMMLAARYKEEVLQWDRETAPIYLQPAYEGQ